MIPFVLQTLTTLTPILFAALGGVYSERVGIVNISLEGMMLTGAFVAVILATLTGNPLLAVLIAAITSGVMGLIFALFGIVWKRDQVIVGTTINFLALGLTGVFSRALQKTLQGREATPLPTIHIFGNGTLHLLVFVCLIFVPVLAYVLYKTRLGVIVRTLGEKPTAAAASGTNVIRGRVLATIFCGMLCGLGGAALSIGTTSSAFVENMTGGRGFIALAVVVFGRWSPVGALGAVLLFAGMEALSNQLQVSGSLKLPYPLLLAFPYILTLAALALRGNKTVAPAALGQEF
jgi:general nucleoside transport system permease protein